MFNKSLENHVYLLLIYLSMWHIFVALQIGIQYFYQIKIVPFWCRVVCYCVLSCNENDAEFVTKTDPALFVTHICLWNQFKYSCRDCRPYEQRCHLWQYVWTAMPSVIVRINSNVICDSWMLFVLWPISNRKVLPLHFLLITIHSFTSPQTQLSVLNMQTIRWLSKYRQCLLGSYNRGTYFVHRRSAFVSLSTSVF